MTSEPCGIHVFLVGFLLVAPLWQGRADDPQDSVAERRWSVSFSITIVSPGPESALQRAMQANGFGQTSPAFFGFGPTTYPVSKAGEGMSWMASVRYALAGPLRIGMVFGRGSAGETDGYHHPYLNLDFHHSIFTCATLVSVEYSGFRVGLGPSLSFLTTWFGSGGRSTARRGGLLLDAGLSTPAQSLFFFEVTAKYALIPSLTIGPAEATFLNTFATFSPEKINFSHFSLGVGGGVRF